MGINHIIVESDSAILASLIHSSEVELYPLGTLVLKSLQLMSSFKTCNVTHVHRERNMVADYQAKKSIMQEIQLWKLHSAPEFVVLTILDDVAGLARPCMINSAFAAS